MKAETSLAATYSTASFYVVKSLQTAEIKSLQSVGKANVTELPMQLSASSQDPENWNESWFANYE